MSYQAGSRSFSVATGADALFSIRFHTAGGYAAAADLEPGTDFVIYTERVWPVYSVTAVSGAKVRLRLGNGTAWDPDLTVDADALVPLAEVAPWEASECQVMMPASCYWPPPTTMIVPTSLDEGGQVCTIIITASWLEPFQSYIDYSEGGPSGLSLPYDLVGTFSGQRIRVLTGSINVVRSAASPVVEPLPPVEEVVP
jgi:hypothetical protein